VAIALLALLVALVAGAGPAHAHQPVFVEDSADPHLVPIIEDGTVSFAVYGTVSGPDRVAAVRAHLSPGDTLSVELLIPATGPETSFEATDLPRLTVVAPDGTVTELLSTPGERFDEPSSGTSYVRLAKLVEPALDGIYQFEVRAARPARFTLATGQREVGGTVIGYAGAAPDALTTWYATPPTDLPTGPPPHDVEAEDEARAEGASPADGPVASPLAPPPVGGGDGAAGWWVAGVAVALVGVVAGLGAAGAFAARRRAQLDEGSSG
jgi:hypothetical protein